MDQLVQIVGALLILIAYAAAQFGAMDSHSRIYLALNLIGFCGSHRTGAA